MVAHGRITGSLFLIAGGFWQRAREYDLEAYGGLAQVAPKLAAATILAAFASLGLPGLAGFVAEFQIFAGTFAVWPWLAGIGILGILITAVQTRFWTVFSDHNDAFLTGEIGRAHV